MSFILFCDVIVSLLYDFKQYIRLETRNIY